MNKVQAFYDANAAGEWERLSRHKLEFGTTCRVLRRFVPRGSRVLDVGGGPGRYSFLLAENDCRVTLYDLSRRAVELAEERSASSGPPLEACIQGNVLDLGARPLGSFDAVLCMGPLYHLLEEADRVRAVDACLAVLRPGGMFVASFISCYAPLLDVLRNRPEELKDHWAEYLDYVSTRTLVVPEGGGFTDAYFFRPDEISLFMARFPLEQLLVTGIEGIANQTDRGIYSQGEAALEAALEIIERTGTDPLTWGACDHFLYVGRRL